MVNDTCHKEWDDILERMIFLWRESAEDTCTRKNPYEKEYWKAREEFQSIYGVYGEKLQSEEELERKRKYGKSRMHFMDELPMYKNMSDKYFAAEKEIEDYRITCKDEAMDLLKEHFLLYGIREASKMHYITSDIHNDNERFETLLNRLQLQSEDKLYIVGDLFDRTNYNPDPVGVYFNVLNLENRCQVIRGNHEQELARYIMKYFKTKEKQRKKLEPYTYNTFELLLQRLTLVDMEDMAKWMLQLPLQIEETIEGKSYLFAHAMTANPNEHQIDEYYLQGDSRFQEFLKNGVDEYISVCGHFNPSGSQIWRNEKENVILCDCGCGYRSGKLGCFCIETGEEIYI